MRHARLGTALKWLCGALCVAAVVAWVAQLHRAEALAWSGGSNTYQIASLKNQFEAIAMFDTPSRAFIGAKRRLNVAFIRDYDETLFNRWGFAFAVRAKRGGGIDYIALPMIALRVPCWFVVLALAGSFILLWRSGRRDNAMVGYCPTCGYDIRATPDRCPECGNAIARSA